MSRRTGIIVAALFLAAGAICGAISALEWKEVSIEGAYLNRSVGHPAFSGTFSVEDNSASLILLGAAIGLASAALVTAATTLTSARRAAPPPPEPAAGHGR